MYHSTEQQRQRREIIDREVDRLRVDAARAAHLSRTTEDPNVRTLAYQRAISLLWRALGLLLRTNDGDE